MTKFQLSNLKILKDDVVKVLYEVRQQIWETRQWWQDWKSSVFITIPKKGNAEECPNYCTTEFISHAGKVMLKILQARSLQCVNRELPEVQARFRKGRASEIKLWHLLDQGESNRVFQKKTPTSASFDFVDHNKLLIILRNGNTRSPASSETFMRIKKQQLKADMKQLTGSKLLKLRLYIVILLI